MSSYFDSSTSTSLRLDLGGVIAYLRDEPCLGDVEMPASLRYLLARLVHCGWRPVGDYIEIPRYLEQLIQNHGPGLPDDFLHGQNAHVVIPDTQVITFRFDVGIDHLVIEKLCVLGLRSNYITRSFVWIASQHRFGKHRVRLCCRTFRRRWRFRRGFLLPGFRRIGHPLRRRLSLRWQLGNFHPRDLHPQEWQLASLHTKVVP
jgi:hypothetical protein